MTDRINTYCHVAPSLIQKILPLNWEEESDMKLTTPETSGRLGRSVFDARTSGIVWVIFASYNWLKVTLETMDQL